MEALKTEDQADLLEIVWNIGIRKPRALADIEWEDVSEEGVSKIQFKALQRIGREYVAPSSDAGGEPTEARPSSEASKASEAETTGIARPALPPHTPSIR